MTTEADEGAAKKETLATIDMGEYLDLVSLIRTQDAELQRLKREMAILPQMLAHERCKSEHLVKILVGIHALLPPADSTGQDGITYTFAPPEEIVLQAWHGLAKRIREVPDAIARASNQPETAPDRNTP